MFRLRKKYIWILLLAFIFSIFPGLGVKAADTAYSNSLQPLAAGLGQSVVLQWYLLGDKPDGLDQITEKLNEHLEDKVGVSVNFCFISWDDFSTRKKILLRKMIGNRYLDFTWKNEDPNMYKNLKSFNDGATVTRSLGFEFNAAPVQKEANVCKKVWEKYVPKLLSGEYDPVKYLPTLNSALKKAGLDKILAEKQKQYDKWYGGRPEKPIANTSGIRLVMGGEMLTLKYPPAFSRGIVIVPIGNS